MNSHPLKLALAISAALLPYGFNAHSVAADTPAPENGQAQNPSMETVSVVGRYTVNKSIDTATGLGLTLRETPQSVTVFTAERIKDQNINNIMDTVKSAIGISSTQQDNVRASMYSRGFDISNYQIDGVPLSWSLAGDAGETTADVSIYERVEFVRGATGLMTGVGDPSASINFVRKKADQTELTGYVDVDYGRWDKKQITADVASGLNESGTVRGRMVAKYTDGDSYQDDFEERQDVLYGVIETDLTDSTVLRLGGSYQHRDPRGATWGTLPAFYDDGGKTNWNRSKTTGLDWTRWETTSENYFVSLDHTFSNGWGLKLNYNNLKYEKDTKLVLLSGAPDRVTGEGMSVQRYRSEGSSKQKSVDVQLTGDYQLFGQQHDFVLGGLYSEQDGKTSTYDPDPLGGNTGWDSVPAGNYYQWGSMPEPVWTAESTLREDNETRQTGIYASTRLSITDDLKVIVGGRVANWERQRTYYGTYSSYGDDDVFIPYLGVLYDLNDQHRVYASYTEIMTPQNARDINKNYLDPLTGINTEVGLKSSFFDGRLQTSVAVFRIEQDNLAQATGETIPDSNNETAYRAAQGAESKGFELEVVGQLMSNWDISVGYSQFTAEDEDGEKVNTLSPRKQFKLFTTYNFTDTLPSLTIGGGVNWQSEIYAEGSGHRVSQEDYLIASLMARYELSEHMSLQLNVDNLFDEEYYDFMTAGWYNEYRYGAPRNATLRFSYNF